MTDLEQIHADLRSSMNGITAKSIRESGMGYRLVYGVELPRLREIASGYTPDRRLAQALWNEDIRESKILAILLFPVDEFDRDMANLWVESLHREQAELAGLLVMDILVHEPYAAEQAFLWMADDRQMHQLCGFLLITRLMMQGAVLSPDAAAEFQDQAEATLGTDYLPLRKAVQNALLRFQNF